MQNVVMVSKDLDKIKNCLGSVLCFVLRDGILAVAETAKLVK